MKKTKKGITFLKQKSYVLAAVLMLVAVFGMTGVYFAEQKQEKKQLAQQQEQERPDRQEESAQQKKESAAQKKEELAAQKKEELAAQKKEELAAQNKGGIKAEKEELLAKETDDFLDSPEVIASLGKNHSTEATEKEENVSKQTPKEADENGQKEREEVQETAASAQQLHFDGATELQWPLSGNVIMNYSMDQTIYFATLDQYKYNPAIIIQGNVNDKVQAVADGIVSHIETNEETGCTVTVDLGDEYCAVYGQLKEVPLQAGDYVNAGDTIGYVSEPTKYYTLEGPNLYFQLLKAHTSVNPMEYMQ